MKSHKFAIISAATITSVFLASCEKDDVIIEDPVEPDKPESVYRPATAESSAYSTRVFEYTPAPGQFIGETVVGGMTGEETTPEAAAQWAEKRLESHQYVSLGSFGGYIVVGFDHSILANTNGYDLAVEGNPFLSTQGGSNEPGIVYVMQDTNGNGLPDDTWYELKGSETDKSGTRRDYSVTYFRPGSDNSPVQWVDCDGKSGTIDYLAMFHKQPSYYPQWIESDSYTLSGTLLASRNVHDSETGFWNNAAYAWGYADNFGEDILDPNTTDAESRTNGFRIANAIDAAANPVKLPFIDFVKVQTGVLAKSGPLGEVSTEVFCIYDYNIGR